MTRWLLWLYKRSLSPLLHTVGGSMGACRFQPTCSEYAAIAIHAHGPLRGCMLAVRRVLRCHPLGGSGFDPVPGTGFDGAACADTASSPHASHCPVT